MPVCLTRALNTVLKLAVRPQDGARRVTASRQGPQIDASVPGGGLSKKPACTPGASQLETSGGRNGVLKWQRLPPSSWRTQAIGEQRSSSFCERSGILDCSGLVLTRDQGQKPQCGLWCWPHPLFWAFCGGCAEHPDSFQEMPGSRGAVISSHRLRGMRGVRCRMLYFLLLFSHSNNASFYSLQERHRAVKTSMGRLGL